MAKRKQSEIPGRHYDVTVFEDVELPLEVDDTGCRFRRISHCRWERRFRFFEPNFGPVFIGLVLSGEGMQTDEQGAVVPLLPGCVFACGGGGYRGHAVVSAEGMEVLFMVTHASASAEFVVDHLGTLPLAFLTPRASELEPVFRILLREGKRMGRSGTRTCNRLGEVIILQASEALTEGPRPLRRREFLYLKARRYILEHLENRLTAASVAAATGISRTYLARIFSEFAKEPPLAYIQRQKMALASEYLQSGGHSVKEIALRIGFDDPLSFSRTFKRVTGRPPSFLNSGAQNRSSCSQRGVSGKDWSC